MGFVITLLVTFFAGMGAGLGTGFAGMSAAAVISPMLITFLGMDPYMAVGIALSGLYRHFVTDRIMDGGNMENPDYILHQHDGENAD